MLQGEFWQALSLHTAKFLQDNKKPVETSRTLKKNNQNLFNNLIIIHTEIGKEVEINKVAEKGSSKETRNPGKHNYRSETRSLFAFKRLF